MIPKKNSCTIIKRRIIDNINRTKILGSAGSKPADEFIEDFLGRPFSTDAYIELLTNL